MRPESALSLVSARGRSGRGRRRVGVLVPWANQVVEVELPMLSRDAVAWHYARLVPQPATTALDDAFLAGLHAAVPGALAQLSRLPLDGTVLACTSAGFTGAGGDSTCVVSAFHAIVESLHLLRAGRVVLITPYPQAVMDREVEAFAGRQVEVLASAALGRDDGFAEVSADDVNGLVRSLPAVSVAAADALVLSCTAWPTLDLISDLETETGVPVVSSNLALAVHASRLAEA